MDLIKVEPREMSGRMIDSINARELWSFVESGRQFADWMKQRIESYGLVDGVDFTVHKFVNGNATQIDYYLSIDIGKQLAMVENNDKGREIRLYFIECERRSLATKRFGSMEDILADPKAICALIGGYAQQVIDAKETIAAQTAKLEVVIPKANGFDLIAQASEGSLLIGEAAKKIGIGPTSMFKWCQANDWIFRRSGSDHWTAYQRRIKQGFLEEKVTTIKVTRDGIQEDKIVSTVRVTGKGMTELAKHFQKQESSLVTE